MQIMNLVFQSSPNNMPDSLKLLVAIASFYPWTLAHPQTPTLARPNPKRHKSPFEPQIPEPWCTKTCPCFVCDGVCGGEARLDLGLKKPESSHFSSPPPSLCFWPFFEFWIVLLCCVDCFLSVVTLSIARSFIDWLCKFGAARALDSAVLYLSSRLLFLFCPGQSFFYCPFDWTTFNTYSTYHLRDLIAIVELLYLSLFTTGP